MFLVAAATSFEMDAFLRACPPALPFTSLITGVGPVEAAVRLTAFVAQSAVRFQGVVNFGVAGAYCREEGGADLLDLCLAEREILEIGRASCRERV